MSAGIIKRLSRHGLRVSHLHRCYRLDTGDHSSPILLFAVVQGYSIPCHWAHVYALVPGCELPLSSHFRFEVDELESYRQHHPDQSLRWMDTQFMFELALDQMLRKLVVTMPQLATFATLQAIEPVNDGELLRYYINGSVPLLDALLSMCGEHYLLYRQLQDIKAFPVLHIN